MLFQQKANARRVSFVPLLLLFLSFSFAVALFASVGCGTGPYESCLADGDCPTGKVCNAGACKTRTVTPTEPKTEPVSKEPVVTEPKAEPSAQEPAQTEPVGLDGGQETVPEIPKETQPEPPIGCQADTDCKNGEVCDKQVCVPAPVASCIPNKHVGVFQHTQEGIVRRIVPQPGGNYVAIYFDGTLVISDAVSGRSVFVGTLPFNAAMAVFWSPDGKTLAIVDQKDTLYLWSTTSFGPGKAGRYRAFSADSSSLLLAQQTKQIDYMDPKTGNTTKSVTLEIPANALKGSSQVEFSPGGKYLVAFDRFERAIVWDTVTGKIAADFAIPAQGNYFQFKNFLGDDLFVIEMFQNNVTGTHIFSISQKKSIATLPRGIAYTTLSPSGDAVLYMEQRELKIAQLSDTTKVTSTNITAPAVGSLNAVAFHANSTSIVVGRYVNNASTITSYRMSDYSYRMALQLPGQEKISLSFHPTKPLFLTSSGDGVAKVWNLTYNANGSTPKLNKLMLLPQPNKYEDYKTGLFFDKDWSRAVLTSKSTVTLWDVTNDKQVFLYSEPPPGNPKNPTTGSGIHDVAFQPNGFVSVFQSKVLQRWTFASGTPTVRSLGDLSSYASTLAGVHPVTGTIFIYAVTDASLHSVFLINPSGTQVLQHHTFKDRLWTTAIANKQEWFVGVTRNREAIVIDMKTGKELARLPVASGSAVARFGADDKYLAIRAGVDIEIFDTTTWKKIQSLPSSSDSFAIHPKGQHIATVTSSGDVEIYDIKTKKLLNTLVSKSTSKGINILKYNSTGSHIGFGSDRYGTAEVWTCAP